MKCIQCGIDNKLKDRTGNYGRCKSCRHPFVFEPTSMTPIKVTDPMFAKAIADLSANNTLYFTQKQFLYFLENRFRSKGVLPVPVLVVLLVFFNAWAPAFIGGILSGVTGTKLFVPLVSVIVNVLFIAKFYFDTKSPKLNYQGRGKSAINLIVIGVILLVIAGIGLLGFNSYLVFSSNVILGMTSIYLGYARMRNPVNIASQPMIEMSQLQIWLANWTRVNEPIANILQPPQEAIAPAAINPDVTAYSFDRLVVTDTAAIAQLLIANNFHFENNCAILSITGYPQSIFATAMEMLRRNPELKVFAFHDCSPQGVSLIHQLRTSPTWFPDTAIEIFDVGLLPRQIAAVKNTFIQTAPTAANAAKQLPAEVRQSLSKDELVWLDAGNIVELESFSTQRLLRVLQRGISGSRDFSTGEDSIIYSNDTSVYAFDSFG